MLFRTSLKGPCPAPCINENLMITTQNPIVAHHSYGQGHRTIFGPILLSMQAGQNPHDPLTQLNNYLGFGALSGVNDCKHWYAYISLLRSSRIHWDRDIYTTQLQSMMSSLQFLDQIIASKPHLAVMESQVRQVIIALGLDIPCQHRFYRPACKVAVLLATHLMVSEATTPSPTTPGQQ